jgi:uncharacterized BrkB/YihY/UPF0761 family membrane protein
MSSSAQYNLIMDKTIMKNKTIDAAYENSSLVVNANYYYFIVLLFVVILLICLLMRLALLSDRVQYGGSHKHSYPLFLIIIILFSITCLFTIYKLLSNNKAK